MVLMDTRSDLGQIPRPGPSGGVGSAARKRKHSDTRITDLRRPAGGSLVRTGSSETRACATSPVRWGQRCCHQHKGTWRLAGVCPAAGWALWSPVGSSCLYASHRGKVHWGHGRAWLPVPAHRSAAVLRECLHHLLLLQEAADADKCLFEVRQPHLHPSHNLGCESFSSAVFWGCVPGKRCPAQLLWADYSAVNHYPSPIFIPFSEINGTLFLHNNVIIILQQLCCTVSLTERNPSEICFL